MPGSAEQNQVGNLPGNTHIYGAGIVAIEPDDRLAARLYLYSILRSKPRDNLDAIRHDGKPLPAPGSALSCKKEGKQSS